MAVLTFWQMQQAQAAAGRAESSASRAADRTEALRTEVRHLQAQVDRLSMVTEALWTFLRDRAGVSEEMLLDRVREIDLSDGCLDGKVRVPPQGCPGCGRTLHQRHDRCIYCGAEVERSPFR